MYKRIPDLLDTLYAQAERLGYKELWFRLFVVVGKNKLHLQTNAKKTNVLLNTSKNNTLKNKEVRVIFTK